MPEDASGENNQQSDMWRLADAISKHGERLARLETGQDNLITSNDQQHAEVNRRLIELKTDMNTALNRIGDEVRDMKEAVMSPEGLEGRVKTLETTQARSQGQLTLLVTIGGVAIPAIYTALTTNSPEPFKAILHTATVSLMVTAPLLLALLGVVAWFRRKKLQPTPSKP